MTELLQKKTLRLTKKIQKGEKRHLRRLEKG